jgi:hypothetical protein
MVANVYFPNINDKYQELIIDGLVKYFNQALEISYQFLEKTASRIAPKRILQFVFMVMIQLAFGFTKSGTFSFITSGKAEKVKSYFSSLNEPFPGGSTSNRRMGQILKTCRDEIMALASSFQDEFYTSVHDWAISTFKNAYRSKRCSITPPPECFLGLIAPSKLFPDLTVEERGELLPYFYALIYLLSKRDSNTAEVIGELKTPSLESDSLTFPLAGKFGFFGGPPGKNAVYFNFRYLEQVASEYNSLINDLMVNLDILNLTIGSVDGTNIPVDRRDTTGSIGTGSSGTFYGHKSSIACEAQCIPLNCVLDTGHCSDKTLFFETIAPVKELAERSGQEIWCEVADAAYSDDTIIDEVEAMNAIPLIDINPKNSSLLQELKVKGGALSKIVKKAFKAAPKEIKRKIRDALKAISKKRAGQLSLEEKKSMLRAIASLIGKKILKEGLSPDELIAAERARREVLRIRRMIRSKGTPFEKKIGLTALLYGSIEWLLLYAVRGQNEGINGLLKKRGNLIGDGQHTSWITGKGCLTARQMMDCVGIKHVACVKFLVTEQRDHLLRCIHNWRHNNKKSFCIIILVIFCR